MKKLDTKKLSDLAPNERNPRTITPEKLQTLRESLRFYGDLGGIILNRTSGHLLGGHQRIKAFSEDGEAKVVILTRLKTPDAVGTVAYGYVQTNGTRYGYREVEWDATKEKGAMLAANKFAGEFVLEQVKELVEELQAENFDITMTGFDESEILAIMQEGEQNNPYTPKIEAPIYTPTLEKKPEVKELVDSTKRDALAKRIAACKAEPKVKQFLLEAANRHLVFDYALIAEYYARSDKDVQALFEESALVIIDFKKALENGFVRMTKELNEIQKRSENQPA